MLSLAATLPMMAGRIDLTVGFGIVMWHILAISLQVKLGVPWPLAIMIVLACAGLVGLFNGLLVEVAQVDSFVATLGNGTILYALALWLTDGRQIVGPLSPTFIAVNTMSSACRSGATSTRSARTRKPPRSTEFRCARMSSACLSAPD
jgi:ribose transport system permease protein